MRVGMVLGGVVLCCLVGFSGLSSPGGGRRPGGVYDEILRSQVLGPGTKVPEARFILVSAGSLTTVQIAELSMLGLSVEASAGGYTRVKGPLTSFATLGPDGQGLSWVEAVVPEASYMSDDDGIPGSETETLSVEQLLQSLGVGKLHEKGLKGQGVNIAVLDGGFTGELGELLPGRVQYLEIVWTGNVPQLVERYEHGEHGEACAQAIAAIAPLATYYLVTINDPIDVDALIGFLRDGTLHLDIISESIGWTIPADHNDGKGFLAQQAEKIVDMGIAFFQSSGNYAAGQTASRSFYSGTFTNADRGSNLFHDFDPSAPDTMDRNTLAVEVAAWPGSYKPQLQVVLEWDGWPWQVRDNPNIWTKDSIIKIQDLDLVLYYQTPDGTQKLKTADSAQLGTLYDAVVPLEPVETLTYSIDRPGRYLIGVANVTTTYNEQFKPYERPVEFHLYVSVSGTTFTMEHSTPEGSLLNVSAGSVISIGAVGRTSGGWSVMSFSSRGPTDDGRLKPEFVAPNYYWSPVFEDYFGGTSAAAPVAAGVAALLRGNWPLLSRADLLACLAQSVQKLCGTSEWNGICDPVGGWSNNVVGYGLLDAWEAYQAQSAK